MTDLAGSLKSDGEISTSASRFDRAWGVVAGAGLLMFVNLGPVLYYTSGVFTQAITDDTGWTRGTIAAAGLPANLLITFTLPLVGWAVDTYGTRRIALLSSILFAIGMLLLGQFSHTPGLYSLLLVVASSCGLRPPLHPPVEARQIARARSQHSTGMILRAILKRFVRPTSFLSHVQNLHYRAE